MLWWLLGFIGTGAGIYGLLKLVNIINVVGKEMHRSLILFFIAAFSHVALFTFISYLGVTGTALTNVFWNVVPIVYIIAAITWIWSMILLMRLGKGWQHGEVEG